MSNLVEEVARKLGGEAVLGQDVRSQADLALAVRRRLPLAVLDGLAQAGLSGQEIERFVIPPRTRGRRPAGRLARHELADQPQPPRRRRDHADAEPFELCWMRGCSSRSRG